MSELWVCGLDAMPELVRRVRPARLVSLLPRRGAAVLGHPDMSVDFEAFVMPRVVR